MSWANKSGWFRLTTLDEMYSLQYCDFLECPAKRESGLTQWQQTNTCFMAEALSVREPLLTHWGQDKMAASFQTTLSNAFSWMKMLEFRLKFHWSLFIRIQLTIFQHWFIWWLGADQATSHYLNQWWLDYWCIYASSRPQWVNERTIPHMSSVSTDFKKRP